MQLHWHSVLCSHTLSPCIAYRLPSLKALSTNMLYYAGYNLASKMGKELGEADPLIHDLERKANLLKATIQKR